ncbi:segregation and condensation protein ScpA [Secundilactobacillus pentosiphilus]|uniref:Segregation and condensation protein A n=1 Tax=Secundilactobacillus pentosiphilus TaxID=1714682 RepID=A0A1Z5IWB2_9LACO|nr:segregation/condensation protein A [Secundilactobacillus pentosiphilus]GAX02903.1 segregation and condensation protein ScpA [Secundilactobacillus pentosiphilus]GAX05892.1 segregation and condensation protein ScpA [Secundilactobacillus pentosiphilus]
MSDQPVLIHVQNFEGPLDLLLHLIKSSSIDIYDIPIVAITDQYMTALRQMQDHQLDVAGDYFVMAATLMKMKAKLLLPADETPEKEEDDEPSLAEMQDDLVNRLVKYQRYKQAAGWFKQQAAARQKFYTRPEMAVPADVKLGKLAPGLTISNLQQVLAELTSRQRQPELPMRLIQDEQYTVKGQIHTLRFKLSKVRVAVSFGQLFDQKPNKEELVTTFLALLEMTKQHEIAVDQPSRVLPITVKPAKLGEEK